MLFLLSKSETDCLSKEGILSSFQLLVSVIAGLLGTM